VHARTQRPAAVEQNGKLHTEPIQRPGMSQRVGVAAERLPESVWWLDSSGEVFAGAKAMNAAVSTAIGHRIPLVVYHFPGVGPAQEAVYRWVAAHRYRFRGVTPLCESEPNRCTTPQAS